MFEICIQHDGAVELSGRFDASQVDAARMVFDCLTTTTRVDFRHLDYISSAGLGILLRTQKRLSDSNHSLILIHMNKPVRDIFRIARFDVVFKVEDES